MSRIKRLSATKDLLMLSCVGEVSTTTVKSTKNIEAVFLHFQQGTTLQDISETKLTKKQTRLRLDIGTLPELKPGSIWKDQKCVATGIEHAKILRLEIFAPQNALEETFSKIFNGTHQEILFNSIYYRLPCLVISQEDFIIKDGNTAPTKIVFSCIEVFRHFLARTRNMSHKLFHGGLQNRKVYDRYKSVWYCDIETRKSIAIPWFKKGIHKIDGPIVAHLLTSQVARKCVHLLYKSITEENEERHHIFPKCNFPFNSKIELLVSGKHIDFENGTYFYVYSIEGSNYETGHDFWGYGSDIDFRKVEGSKPKPLPVQKLRRPIKIATNIDALNDIADQSEGDNQFIPIDREIGLELFLGNKAEFIGMVEKEDQKYTGTGFYLMNGDAKQGTTADLGGGGSGTVSTNLYVSNESLEQELPNSFDKFYQAIFFLQKEKDPQKKLQVNFLTINSAHNFLSIFFKGKKRERDWCNIGLKNDREIIYHQRRAILAEIVGNSKATMLHFYFLEIEPDASGKTYSIYIVNKKDFSRILPAEFIKILKDCADNRGVNGWHIAYQKTSYKITTIDHYNKSDAYTWSLKFRAKMKTIYLNQQIENNGGRR